MASYIITHPTFRSETVNFAVGRLEFDASGQATTDDDTLAAFVKDNFSTLGYKIVSTEEAEKARKEAEARAAEIAEFKKSLNPALKGKLTKQLRELKEAWGNAETPEAQAEIEAKIKDLEEKLS